MKKWWIIVVLMFITACGKNNMTNIAESTDRYTTAVRWDKETAKVWFVSDITYSAETIGGLYITPLTDIYRIYYWNEETNDVIPLCGKVECTHDELSCNACFPFVGTAPMDVYRNQLYVWASDEEGKHLFRMELDGSNREIVCELETEDGRSGSPNIARFHDGDVLESQCDIYKYDLNTKHLEKVYTMDEVCYYVVIDQNFYYSCPNSQGPVMKVDLTTGEETLFIDGKAGVVNYDGQFFYVSGGYGDPLNIYTEDGELIETLVCTDFEADTKALITPSYILFATGEGESACMKIIGKDQIGLAEKTEHIVEIPRFSLRY